MTIYTKKGDHGQTHLANGSQLSKNEVIFETIGTIDELNSWIGMCEALSSNKIEVLQKIQNNLFSINAILAKSKNVKFDDKHETKFLEQEIDRMEEKLPKLKNFILPGGSEIAAVLHVTRTVCRRAERRLISISKHQELIPYLNRLSDYLFMLVRYTNLKEKKKEITWRVK